MSCCFMNLREVCIEFVCYNVKLIGDWEVDVVISICEEFC